MSVISWTNHFENWLNSCLSDSHKREVPFKNFSGKKVSWMDWQVTLQQITEGKHEILQVKIFENVSLPMISGMDLIFTCCHWFSHVLPRDRPFPFTVILINFYLKEDPPNFGNTWEWVTFSSVQSLSRVRLFATPWTAACQAFLSITSSQSLLKLTSIQSVMPSSHLILCHPLLLLPSILPSIRVFSSESVLHIKWPKHWRFSFNPSNEYSGLISFRIDWVDLLAVQGTLKCLLQHHSSKASIRWCSAFFMVKLSYPHMTTGKTIALTRQNFVGKIMSLILNMLPKSSSGYSKLWKLSYCPSAIFMILFRPFFFNQWATLACEIKWMPKCF